jgi:hypothetical protein
MHQIESRRFIMKLILRILFSSVAYLLGSMITGALAPTLHLPALRAPQGADPGAMFLLLVIATPLLMLACIPLASGLRGGYILRWLALATLLFVAIGINTMIEAKVFSNVVSGSALAASMYSLLACFASAAVLAMPMGTSDILPATLRPLTPGGWIVRVVLAWLAFPVCYLAFGMCVGPFVMHYYESGGLGLRIPTWDVLLRTQALRSALFFAASLPAVILWRKSRGAFIVAMGLVHAFAVGIFELMQARFFPTVLRVIHGIEIAADSFAYAAILGMLFLPGSRSSTSHPPDRAHAAGSGTSF